MGRNPIRSLNVLDTDFGRVEMFSDLSMSKTRKLGKTTLFASLALAALNIPAMAIADSKEDCIVGGRVFEAALVAQAVNIAFGDDIDWRRVDYYSLSKPMQSRLVADVAAMRPNIEMNVSNLRSEIDGWNRQGMDGLYMFREIVHKAFLGTGEEYSVICLKRQQENESKAVQPNGEKKGNSSPKKTRS